MLAGLGFEPIMAAALALIANTAPVAFGSLGIPVTTLGGLLAPMLGHDTQTTTRALSSMVGRQLPLFSLIIPAYLVVFYAGWGRMIDVWPAVLTAGGTFAIGQFVVSNYVGPELTDALSALFSLTSVALLLRVWQPARTIHRGRRAAGRARCGARPGSRVFRAYATYGILIVTVLIGQIGNFAGLATLKPPANVTALLKCGQGGNRLCPDPWLGRAPPLARRASAFPSGNSTGRARTGFRTAGPWPWCSANRPVVAASTPYPLTYRLDFLAAAGTLVFLAALIAFVPMSMVGMAPGALRRCSGRPSVSSACRSSRSRSFSPSPR